MWASILTLAVQLIGWLLGKDAEAKESRKKFLEFVDQLGKDSLISKKIKDNYDAQLEGFKKEP